MRAPQKPIPRVSPKKASKGFQWSTAKRSTKPIRKVNPKAKAKRVAGYRKMLSGKEYKAARAEAFARAGNRCEYVQPANIVHDAARCPNDIYVAPPLHAHHLRYPKSRPIEASDLLIVCKRHHEVLESQKMHKTRMF